jgi:hypothetical protein
MIIIKRQFPKEWKTAFTQPTYKGKGNTRKPGNGNYYQLWGKYIQE